MSSGHQTRGWAGVSLQCSLPSPLPGALGMGRPWVRTQCSWGHPSSGEHHLCPGRLCLCVLSRVQVWSGPPLLLGRPVWSASALLSSSVGTFARALDCSSSVRQPSLHMSAAAASRDITLVSGLWLDSQGPRHAPPWGPCSLLFVPSHCPSPSPSPCPQQQTGHCLGSLCQLAEGAIVRSRVVPTGSTHWARPQVPRWRGFPRQGCPESKPVSPLSELLGSVTPHTHGCPRHSTCLLLVGAVASPAWDSAVSL